MSINLRTIGRKDKIDLPEFNLYNLDAKVDTGAYGNALHCHKITVKEAGDEQILHFHLLDPTHPEYEERDFQTIKFTLKAVKNSFGQKEDRYVISTVMILFGEEYRVDFSLTDRQNLKHPVLIGRKLIRNRFIVDVRKKYLSYNEKVKHK